MLLFEFVLNVSNLEHYSPSLNLYIVCVRACPYI